MWKSPWNQGICTWVLTTNHRKLLRAVWSWQSTLGGCLLRTRRFRLQLHCNLYSFFSIVGRGFSGKLSSWPISDLVYFSVTLPSATNAVQRKTGSKNWIDSQVNQKAWPNVAKRGQICWQESLSVNKFDRIVRFSARNRGWFTWLTIQGRKVGHGFSAAVANPLEVIAQVTLPQWYGNQSFFLVENTMFYY